MKTALNNPEIKEMKAPAAIKLDAPAITLPCLIKCLQQEKEGIEAELNRMPPDAWLNVRGRALANREQELHTTLVVLRTFKQAPIQITEPSL